MAKAVKHSGTTQASGASLMPGAQSLISLPGALKNARNAIGSKYAQLSNVLTPKAISTI